MDYLAHQRMLKDRSMRRKREKEKQGKNPQVPPTKMIPPLHPKPTPKPKRGGRDPPVEDEKFDMMAYMKK